MHSISITTFYLFTPLPKEEIARLEKRFHRFARWHRMRGLVILAPEGINGTVAGSHFAIARFKKLLTQEVGEMLCKDSFAPEKPFTRWSIKIRKEIVSLKNASILPESDENYHLSPEEWHRTMQEEDVVLLDTRNSYETEIGMFKNAVDPKLKHFQFFPDFVRKSNISKDKKVLMYCTGGIRCEKALIEMQSQGYKHVYQLKGGILQYLKEFPNGFFKGECFVFDHRTSVDKNLQPSQLYTLCPHCGDPGKERIECRHCRMKAVVCEKCLVNEWKETCSKNCAHVIERTSLRALLY